MNTIKPQYYSGKYIFNSKEKEDKFNDRLDSLLKQMNYYIKESEWEEFVKVNKLILAYALVDYFVDIDRLKEFSGIENINSIKLISYTSYWLLRRKPIQIIDESQFDLLYVNERFILAYVMSFLSNPEHGHIFEKDNQDAFCEAFLYFLKFRQVTAQNIEMMILAFFAGQIYQSSEDISDMLPYSDYEDIPWEKIKK